MKKFAVLAAVFGSCLAGWSLSAGDAVVIGYNPDGVWTAVTYYASSTPKGGPDYKDVAGARKAALRDLKVRAGQQMTRSEVVGESDQTGFVAVARGATGNEKDVTVAAHAKTEEEAEKRALADLTKAGATKKQKIVYKFFSHGADSSEKQ